jgi:ATP adenylyltransferase
MQQLWAPWRMEFINAPKPEGCFFCEAANPDPVRDREHYVLARTELCLALLNIYPYNNGHLMVAPRAHLPTLQSLPPEVAADLTALTQRALRALDSVLSPEGFNLGINQGKVAGAGVADHVHQHVVPRWSGDTNFMPVIGETKVLAEHLRHSYEKLRPAFERLS